MAKNSNWPTPLPVRRALRQLGDDVVTWRKLQRLTAAQVADRAGVDVKTLRSLEHGDGSISIENALRLARALGVLDQLASALDPYATDVGRLRTEERLPERVRPPRSSDG
ncbi:MAG: helix-turn-helix transcriptional regulator [Actinomycetota bacterium]